MDMTPLEYANTLTSDRGTTPARDIAVRWHGPTRTWNATNTIEKGWSSTAYIRGTLPHVLGRLNVIVTAIKCDDCSMYFHCVPRTEEAFENRKKDLTDRKRQLEVQIMSGMDQAWARARDEAMRIQALAWKYCNSTDPDEVLIANLAFLVFAEVNHRSMQSKDPEQT
jgi:hypothetical protein